MNSNTSVPNKHSTFADFQLPAALQKALAALEFTTPTPIQQQAIPAVLTGRDLIGCAQTGTGKTGAFCIPMLVKLLEKPESTALVLAPTRELALQIEEFWNNLTRFMPEISCTVLIGGVSMNRQTAGLRRRPRLIVATPGRLLDHLGSRAANLSKTGILVLDEADRMLDMGFAPQLEKVMRFVPKERQTLLFSATWGAEVDRLSKRYLHNAQQVSVGTTSRAAPTISQSVIHTSVAGKNDCLLDELNRRPGSVLIFARTKSRTDRVARFLESYGVQVNRIHGGRSQNQRNLALADFRDGQTRVLVATDIAARGIDVTDIAHVINYDLPQVPEDYIHRIGRTGRAGSTGQAVSLLTGEDKGLWQDIVKHLQRTGSVIPQVVAAVNPVSAQDHAKAAPAGERGRRGGNRGGGQRHGGGGQRPQDGRGQPQRGGFGGQNQRRGFNPQQRRPHGSDSARPGQGQPQRPRPHGNSQPSRHSERRRGSFEAHGLKAPPSQPRQPRW